MKYFTIINLLSLAFSYIDQTCYAGKFGYGVCAKRDSCTLYGDQKGFANAYIGSVTSDVICCVKQIMRLRDDITYKTSNCLNVKQCKGSVVDNDEFPGSNMVKLCVTGGEIETDVNSVYKVNVHQGSNLNIRSGPSTSHSVVWFYSIWSIYFCRYKD